MAVTELTIEEASQRCEDVITEIQSAVIADREFLEDVLLGILADGHVLLEDVPGTGKTLTANSFASAFGLDFSRVQFTPDLLPNDVSGTNIYNERENTFEFQPGPIFGNVVLADEINRAPPKTQAALLEAMQEKQVTVEGETRQLPEPFFVLATQNPVEQEGTFPLPEAQVDRFFVKTSLGYPDNDGEVEILRRRVGRMDSTPQAEQVMDDPEEVLALQEVPERVRTEDDMLNYISEVCRMTREDHRVQTGVSPRGTQRLLECTRARAVIEAREYATPDDVKNIAESVLAHRLVLTAEAKVNDVDKRQVVRDVLDEVPVPTVN
ncbi:MoxR-like ATPase [Natronoarchaeum philippinense]|uniref:MoxR-like ATPase n=1 Tax=Natronoarchaeum philippinense TaxID=558529 RepID=A0A285P5S1_NATPI|nr:MoxR family ATPase [Natronoarchaeum philippinense]SNZ17082.1 MoxR-like ATPase [Natronoarchaeum philippinense]